MNTLTHRGSILGILSLIMDTSHPGIIFGSSSGSQTTVGSIGVHQGSLLVFEYEIGFFVWTGIFQCYTPLSKSWCIDLLKN